MESIRTFIALVLPEDLKKSLGRLQAKFVQTGGVKWVRPEDMHLTLKFFGDISPDSVDPVCEVLAGLTRHETPFSFEAAGLGAFPNSRNPKVLWAGLKIDARLIAFEEALETELATIGFPREQRPFAPHLTLGRLRDGRSRKDIAALLERYGSQAFGRFQSCSIIVYKSDLRPTGPVHTALKEFILKSA